MQHVELCWHHGDGVTPQSSGWEEEVIRNLGRVPWSGRRGPKAGRDAGLARARGAEPAVAFGSVSGSVEERSGGKWGRSWEYERDSRGRSRLLGEGTESEGRTKVGDDCVHGLVFK